MSRSFFAPLVILGLAACDGAPDDAPDDPSSALTPEIIAGTPVAGEPLRLDVRGAPPGDAVMAWVGAARAAAPVCDGDVCVDLDGAVAGPAGVVDGDGAASPLLVLPADAAGAVLVQIAGPGWRTEPVELTVSAPLPWFGVWTDDYGGQHEIDHQLVRDDYGAFHVLRFDVAARWLLARNDDGNAYAAGAFSRFDWTESGGDLWYCQSAFDAATEADALAATSDASDPAAGGCGGFPWSKLVPAEPAIAGEWGDPWGGHHAIDADAWTDDLGAWRVSRFSNLDRVVIAQNDAGNEYFPGLWSRFDWAVVGDGVWYCQSVYDGPSEWAARAAPPANPADPANAGCGGFAWTQLVP